MLEIRNISKSYGNFRIDDVSLRIGKGEYFILLGRSGAGKSQLLELISGLRNPDSGTIMLNGKDITGDRIQDRKVGFLFQDFALFPHMTVEDNISYSLRVKKMKQVSVREKVKLISGELNVSHLLNRKPDTLSGGEKQRVAVARTLVTSPDILLLDEPMSSVDTPLKDDIRRLLRKINQGGMTILHVTHDHRESIRLATRVGVIHNGHIIQTGTPDEVFSRPASRFVARFAGIQNFFKVEIESNDKDVRAISNFNSFKLNPGNYGAHSLMILRSDCIHLLSKVNKSFDNCIRAKVTEIYRAESGYELYADGGDIFHAVLTDEEMEKMDAKAGQSLYLCFNSSDIGVI